jgi:hypothetical protein
MKLKRDDPTTVHLDFGITRLVLHKGDNPHVEHFAVMLDKWDLKAVGEELGKRGLAARASGESFYLKDPDGLTFQISSKDLGGASTGE